MDHAEQALVTRSMRTTTVICFAIAMSIPIYVAIAWFMASHGPLDDEPPASVAYGLLALAAGLLIAAVAVSRHLKTAAAAKPTLVERLEAHRVATIVSFALREGIAVVGLVITLLEGDLRWCLGLATVSLVSMLLDWPKPAEWARLAADPATAPIG